MKFGKLKILEIGIFYFLGQDRSQNIMQIRLINFKNLGDGINIFQKARYELLVIWDQYPSNTHEMEFVNLGNFETLEILIFGTARL